VGGALSLFVLIEFLKENFVAGFSLEHFWNDDVGYVMIVMKQANWVIVDTMSKKQ